MKFRMQVVLAVLAGLGLLLVGARINAALAGGHTANGQAAKKGKKYSAATAKDVQRCLHASGAKNRIGCLRRIGKPRPSRVEVKDCLGAKATRLQCLERLLIPPPPSERIVNTFPALPASVTQVQFPDFSSDGSRIIANAKSTAFSGGHIVSFKEDGSDFRCLTCGFWNGAQLAKPFPFSDGHRILVRIGQQTPGASADHGVVECTPSVANCSSAAVVPIEIPSAADPNVVQTQRELRIAPDASHLAFTQIRTTASGRQTGIAVVGRLVRSASSYVVDDPRVVAADGELKGFSADGQSVYFARFFGAFDANNPDDVLISLRNGSERRATWHPDWDEDIGNSPTQFRDRGWFVVGSDRGSGRLETLGQLRRPLAIEYGTSSLNFSTFGGGGPAEPWLVDEYGARRNYIGQPLVPGGLSTGWNARPNFNWSPNGREVVFWQDRADGTPIYQDGAGDRVVVSHLPARKGTASCKKKSHGMNARGAKKKRKKGCGSRGAAKKSPTPNWAPPLAGYVPAETPVPQSRPGRFSGELTVSLAPSPDPGYASLLAVRYSNFSDIRGMVLNGTETSYFNPAPGPYGTPCRFSADVAVSGSHTGYLRATDVAVGGQSISGAIQSELDGHRLTLGPI
jgi:hypothetical protein